jgi:hypothetical protein
MLDMNEERKGFLRKRGGVVLEKYRAGWSTERRFGSGLRGGAYEGVFRMFKAQPR